MGGFIYRENMKHLKAQLALCGDETHRATIRGIIKAELKRQREIDAEPA
ncbi:MAG: hypothetical protein ACXWJC_08680 [Croceibacterium sp.]